MDPFHGQILALALDKGLVASCGQEGGAQGEGEELVVGVWTPALSICQEPGRGQVSGCKLILLDGPKVLKDWCPGELLLMPVMHLMKEKFVLR